MLERLLEQYESVCHVLSTGSHSVDNLTAEQWTTAAMLMTTLHPLVEVIQELSCTSYPLLSSVIPVIGGLRRVLRTSSGGLDELRDVLLRLLDETFSDMFDSDELCAATLVGLYQIKSNP